MRDFHREAKLYAMRKVQDMLGRSLSSREFQNDRLFTAKDLEEAFLRGRGLDPSDKENIALANRKGGWGFYMDE